MAVFNYLSLRIICPRCGVEADMEAEFRFGLRDLSRYHIGDTLRWAKPEVESPEARPEGGNWDDEAYVECPFCKRDFWLRVIVRQDIIARIVVETEKELYIPDTARQPPAAGPILQSKWDPHEHAEMMKKRTSPPVSAFFLIDSVEAIQRCIQWLSVLKPYNVPDMEDSQYFKDVRALYESGKVEINFDYDFPLLWQGKEYPEKLRCHFIDKGQYEIELWLPGVVANEIADKFQDGRKGFYCAFMSHAFYD